ncbi:Long-chain-fatty-acid--CoA ligase [Nocardia cerradoensis]|uniref:Long-chain-fatty-acid--CoA ligase n=1 Tax=Nocardia cerradoensis TaxID=85688 RepID=A0A231GU99_9NOCA|nr:AMP-binding protein [Nocardia cerradoensis]OXR40162.1 Long-chain-fatty-acid--CoA ligase [Nocardia cerradoensis]
MNQAEPGSPEYWAAHRPERVAVVSGSTTLTYEQWNDAADRVAEGLARHGLGPGDRVGMRFRLAAEWFVLQRALQKLGVAQVAVNWRLTPAEAMYILRDSGAKGLACNDIDVSGWAREEVGLLITVGQDDTAVGVRYEDLLRTSDAPARFGPARPALVLYTSGTTGRPRGVPPVDPATITDPERLMRYAVSVADNPPLPDGVTSLLTLPIHHGAGPDAAARACRHGGTVVTLDPFDAEEAVRLIAEHKIQAWGTVPTMLLRIQNLPGEILGRYDLSSLGQIGVGAAPVPQSLKEWVIDRFGDDVLWEHYGASEAGMISYAAPEHQRGKPGTSGLPYDGVEIAIVDDDWQRLPIGETGEIAVSTPIVLRNYLGGPELGEDVVRNGFYRTGDVGRLDEDGFLFITDRIKDMIVAGGVNIYPAEIEKALVSHPQVVDAAVIGIPDDDFGEKPLAFIVPAPRSAPAEEELTTHLEGHLARYKRPRQFVFVDELPRNPIGKVLKQQLREPYWQGRERNV